ncbi:hypothetical protein BDP81DRAFT_438525 [Colletotrichum phormii]|uniref:Uncharacterized protein n=1 Tax=Colletotrichum phormii TaxID=359342 RepID=A0AAJ0EBV0_9PEZI|nr:uncharacterized protein BDP81DRAFT_438525 [Colletotrichum phormii]KAK1624017.1 hypothetical protein BDP81DRAFT_438525 [Colletotrichum phormii]
MDGSEAMRRLGAAVERRRLAWCSAAESAMLQVSRFLDDVVSLGVIASSSQVDAGEASTGWLRASNRSTGCRIRWDEDSYGRSEGFRGAPPAVQFLYTVWEIDPGAWILVLHEGRDAGPSEQASRRSKEERGGGGAKQGLTSVPCTSNKRRRRTSTRSSGSLVRQDLP